jgi:large subunit ribosomal protein L10
MPKSRQQKADAIGRLSKEFKGAKSIMFADYQGLTVAKADELRRRMREADVNYIVAKKSLITRAAKDAGLELDAKSFPGMLGVAFGTVDEIAPAKVLGDMSADSPIKLVGGVFEGVIVPAEKAVALSKLPTKHQLLGQLVGTIAAPMSAFVRALDAIRTSMEKAPA